MPAALELHEGPADIEPAEDEGLLVVQKQAAAIQPPETTVAILECLKLPSRPPPIAPPDPPAEEAFTDFGA